MQLITTPSFQLAANISGDKDSEYLILLLPGRLDTKDYVNFTSLLESLKDLGLVVCIDPPGTWESPGDLSLFTTTNYLKAINELIEYFGNKKTILIGHSRGGTVSMLLCSHPSVAGIALLLPNFGSPTPPNKKDRERGYRISLRDTLPGDKETPEQIEFKLPLFYWEDGAKYDPVATLLSCKKPKLVISGSRDKFVEEEEAKTICDRLHEPKVFKTVDTEHDYRRNKVAVDEVNAIVYDFISTYFIAE